MYPFTQTLPIPAQYQPEMVQNNIVTSTAAPSGAGGVDVSKLTVPQLKVLCKEQKITGYSKLGKQALLQKLVERGIGANGQDVPVSKDASSQDSSTLLRAVVTTDFAATATFSSIQPPESSKSSACAAPVPRKVPKTNRKAKTSTQPKPLLATSTSAEAVDNSIAGAHPQKLSKPSECAAPTPTKTNRKAKISQPSAQSKPSLATSTVGNIPLPVSSYTSLANRSRNSFSGTRQDILLSHDENISLSGLTTHSLVQTETLATTSEPSASVPKPPSPSNILSTPASAQNSTIGNKRPLPKSSVAPPQKKQKTQSSNSSSTVLSSLKSSGFKPPALPLKRPGLPLSSGSIPASSIPAVPNTVTSLQSQSSRTSPRSAILAPSGKRFKPLVISKPLPLKSGVQTITVPQQPISAVASFRLTYRPHISTSGHSFQGSKNLATLYYLDLPAPAPVPTLASISLPPSLSQRRRVGRWAIILGGLSDNERRACALVSRMFRYAGMSLLSSSIPPQAEPTTPHAQYDRD